MRNLTDQRRTQPAEMPAVSFFCCSRSIRPVRIRPVRIRPGRIRPVRIRPVRICPVRIRPERGASAPRTGALSGRAWQRSVGGVSGPAPGARGLRGSSRRDRPSRPAAARRFAGLWKGRLAPPGSRAAGPPRIRATAHPGAPRLQATASPDATEKGCDARAIALPSQPPVCPRSVIRPCGRRCSRRKPRRPSSPGSPRNSTRSAGRPRSCRRSGPSRRRWLRSRCR